MARMSVVRPGITCADDVIASLGMLHTNGGELLKLREPLEWCACVESWSRVSLHLNTYSPHPPQVFNRLNCGRRSTGI